MKKVRFGCSTTKLPAPLHYLITLLPHYTVLLHYLITSTTLLLYCLTTSTTLLPQYYFYQYYFTTLLPVLLTTLLPVLLYYLITSTTLLPYYQYYLLLPVLPYYQYYLLPYYHTVKTNVLWSHKQACEIPATHSTFMYVYSAHKILGVVVTQKCV